jgi:hypothetical protein
MIEDEFGRIDYDESGQTTPINLLDWASGYDSS